MMLDGHNIKILELKCLRGQIDLVNQEPALFATSIRENILYGKDDTTMDEIMQAAKLAYVDLFINNLPGHFEISREENIVYKESSLGAYSCL